MEKRPNKLGLNRETLRELDSSDLRDARGGRDFKTLFCSELPSCLCSSLPCGGPPTTN